MRIRELIAKLQEYDGDMQVMLSFEPGNVHSNDDVAGVDMLSLAEVMASDGRAGRGWRTVADIEKDGLAEVDSKYRVVRILPEED